MRPSCSVTACRGEAREIAAEHARLGRTLRTEGRRAIVLSGGELTVTLRGKGHGDQTRNTRWRWRSTSMGRPV